MDKKIEFILRSKNVPLIKKLIEQHVFYRNELFLLYEYIVDTQDVSLLKILFENVIYKESIFGFVSQYEKSIKNLVEHSLLINNCIEKGSTEQLSVVLFELKKTLFPIIEINGFFLGAILTSDLSKVQLLLKSFGPVKKWINIQNGTEETSMFLRSDISKSLAAIKNQELLKFLVINHFPLDFDEIVSTAFAIGNLDTLQLLKLNEVNSIANQKISFKNINYFLRYWLANYSFDEILENGTDPKTMFYLEVLIKFYALNFCAGIPEKAIVEVYFLSLRHFPQYELDIFECLAKCPKSLHLLIMQLSLSHCRYDIYNKHLSYTFDNNLLSFDDIIGKEPSYSPKFVAVINFFKGKIRFTESQTDTLRLAFVQVCKNVDIDILISLIEMGFDLLRVSDADIEFIKANLQCASSFVRESFYNSLNSALNKRDHDVREKFKRFMGNHYTPMHDLASVSADTRRLAPSPPNLIFFDESDGVEDEKVEHFVIDVFRPNF